MRYLGLMLLSIVIKYNDDENIKGLEVADIIEKQKELKETNSFKELDIDVKKSIV